MCKLFSRSNITAVTNGSSALSLSTIISSSLTSLFKTSISRFLLEMVSSSKAFNRINSDVKMVHFLCVDSSQSRYSIICLTLASLAANNS
ncbi:hypothetical protein YC2023_033855 [Brassica napus]